MEINPNSSLPKFNKSSAKKSVGSARQAGATGKTNAGIQKAASLSALQEELKAMPEERPERIVEGRLLKDDPEYPNRQDMRQLGKLVIDSEEENEEADE